MGPALVMLRERRRLAIVTALFVAACGAAEPSTSVAPTEFATADASASSSGSSASPSEGSATNATSCPAGIGAATDPTQDWPSYGRDYANSVDDTAETLLSPTNVSRLAVAWRVDGIGAVTGTPVVIGGIVYFGDWHGEAWAVCAADGRVLWHTQVTDAPVSASVAVTGARVIVADLAGGLHAVDRSTGTIDWSVDASSQDGSLYASPVVVGQTAIIGMTMPTLADAVVGDKPFRASIVSVDVTSGAEQWRFYTDSNDGAGSFVPVWSSVAYDQSRGLLFVGTGNPHTQTERRSKVDLPLSDGVLAIDRATGRQAWFRRLVAADGGRDFDVGGSPNLFTVQDRAVLGVGSKSGEYAVLDRETGAEVWKTTLTAGSDIGGVLSTAAIGDGVIYVGSNATGARGGTIFALSGDDGATVWSRKLADGIIGGSMALADGVLYRATWNLPNPKSTLLALDAADGSVLWSADVAAPLAGGVSISNGTVFVGYGSGTSPQGLTQADGGLIAYRPPDG